MYTTIQSQQPRMVNHNVSNAVGYVPKHIQEQFPNKLSEGDFFISDLDEEDFIAQQIGLYKYSGRALSITNSQDVVYLHPFLQPHWVWISRHYMNVGLPFAEEVVWSDGFEPIDENRAYGLSVFFYGIRAFSSYPDPRWFAITQAMNSKNMFIAQCEEMGLLVPKTMCYGCKSELKDLERLQFPVFMKVAVAVSGLGIFLCHDALDVEDALSTIEPGVPFQVQQKVPDAVFLNVQYAVCNGSLQRLPSTTQILDEYSHSGNIFPTQHNPSGQTDVFAKWMYQQGMRGPFAFDVAYSNGEYYLIECNPRYNAATYPSVIAEKLGAAMWVSRNYTTSKRSWDEVDLKDLEYRREKQSGVVIVNWGCISDEGSMGVMFIGRNMDQVRNIQHRFEETVM